MAQRTAPPIYSHEMVHRLADDLGFALVGVANAKPSSHAEAVRRWIADGKHGEMTYLARNLEVRLDPRALLEGARSVIAVADAYHREADGTEGAAMVGSDAARGRIARYAWGGDYHKILKKRLHALADALREVHPQAEFRCVVDTAPALEREHAMRAGLGWTGKHTLLIHPRYGSYFLLGLIVTTLSLEASTAGRDGVDHCGTCTRCIDACPTQCIEATAERGSARSIDATRCISYLTLEHRSLIDADLHEAMGDWIAGCDVCQEVCPYNQRVDRHVPVHSGYEPRPIARGLPLLEVLDWSPEDRQRAFVGSALKRVKLDMLKRNALIALGNRLSQQDDPAARARIEAIAEDEHEAVLVRETAKQVLDRMTPAR